MHRNVKDEVNGDFMIHYQVGPSVATKEDLPDLTPAEYEAMNKRDPDNIEQARMPMDFQLESDETAGAVSDQFPEKICLLHCLDATWECTSTIAGTCMFPSLKAGL